MDTNDLAKRIRARFDHEQARRILKEKYSAKMLFAYRQGMWRAGPELLCLLESCPVEDEIVVEDIYGTPVKISPAELQHLAFDRWQEQMYAWLVEHEEMARKR